jgi:hypothetical protein
MEGPGGNLGTGGSDPGGGAKGFREPVFWALIGAAPVFGSMAKMFVEVEDADCAALLLGEDEEFDCTWFDWPCPMKG